MEDARSQPVENPRAADGRVPGRRGRATRQRLLEETRDLLGDTSFRDLRVVDISRQAGTSPATFYQYFPDVDAAVLTLTETMVEDGRRALQTLVTESSWEGPDAAATLSDGFLRFFDEHQAMLRVIDMATAEGDERFRQLRIHLLNGVFLALRDVVEQAAAAGRLDPGIDPGAAAGVVTTMLAHVSAHQPGYEVWGVSREALAHTMASVIDRTVRGPNN